MQGFFFYWQQIDSQCHSCYMKLVIVLRLKYIPKYNITEYLLAENNFPLIINIIKLFKAMRVEHMSLEKSFQILEVYSIVLISSGGRVQIQPSCHFHQEFTLIKKFTLIHQVPIFLSNQNWLFYVKNHLKPDQLEAELVLSLQVF